MYHIAYEEIGAGAEEDAFPWCVVNWSIGATALF